MKGRVNKWPNSMTDIWWWWRWRRRRHERTGMTPQKLKVHTFSY